MSCPATTEPTLAVLLYDDLIGSGDSGLLIMNIADVVVYAMTHSEYRKSGVSRSYLEECSRKHKDTENMNDRNKGIIGTHTIDLNKEYQKCCRNLQTAKR